jgi:TRAP-type uncharacterized transport system substrate-binding protein
MARVVLLLAFLVSVLMANTKEFYIELTPESKNKKYDKKLEGSNIFKDIFISADSDVKIDIDNIFLSEKYHDLSIKEIDTLGSLDALNNLRKSQANIAIVRGDVLGAKNNALFGLDAYQDYGIICASNTSRLYLVSQKSITSVNDLRNMRISTGLSSNIAQLYLANISKNSGIKLDITYKSLDLDDSIYALKHGKIDAIFMFGPKGYASKFAKNDLNVTSLPDDFFNNLSIKKGLNRDSFTLKGERIRTFSVQNFVIAPKNTLDAKIGFKVEAMVSAFGCYQNIQNIDSFYGELHPMVKEAVGSIHKRIENENALSIELRHVEKVDNGRKYIFDITNNSENDMNITFEGFETTAFDSIPIKPRHLIEVIPSGDFGIKAKSDKMVSLIYKNPFLYKVGKRKIKTVYKNLSVKNSKVEFFLTIGDDL